MNSASPTRCSRDFALISAIVSGVPTIGILWKLAREIRNAADVIFVSVGDQQRAQLVGPLANVGEVVDDDVDAEHLVVGEHQAAIDDDEIVVGLDHRHVAADLAAAAQRDDANVGPGRRQGQRQVSELTGLAFAARPCSPAQTA